MRWQVIGAGVTGAGHLEMSAGCQDAYAVRHLDGDGVVAVVCDGAGSAPQSAVGSATAATALCNDPLIEDWVACLTQLPSSEWQSAWEKCASRIFSGALERVKALPQPSEQLSDFATTAVVVVVTPAVVASAHVGDGRACASFSTEEGWFPLFVPTRGDAPNETVFLTSFEDAPDSGYWSEEARVHLGAARAFALMTDGCEKGSFECWIPRETGQGFHDPNRPFRRFFDPLAKTLVQMSIDGMPDDEVQKAWTTFVTEGVERFRTESDDRTMVFGVAINES